ncbi:MAG TPA: DpnII family type II restriction endonuclease [Candidatus Kapabacteria bacterium]|nr:DpnII family type II restriction endonuclease [Candidatus Kapabacteria bacterium]HPO62033.1 DpnII family type II restriction endonuclease [Candidatus Kapabacteria bacterium]
MKLENKKYNTVIEKNTFYFFNKDFEQQYEGYINSLKETLLLLKNETENHGFTKDVFEKFLLEKEYGLKALLALTGFSNEYFKRLTTIIRVLNDKELNKLILKDKWNINEKSSFESISEWSDNKIENLIKENEFFRKGIVNLFFEGATIPFLTKTIPLFELKKLSLSKLKFEIPEMIDTLIRYKEKGSYNGKIENNPETLIKSILNELSVEFEKGDLTELVTDAPDKKRTMDFIIPSKTNPKIIIECSYLVTTSSGQGDKSKTEISINTLINKHYPKAKFIGFVDGIGWYVRKKDLERMVNAYSDVYTFHRDELERFVKFIKKELKIV